MDKYRIYTLHDVLVNHTAKIEDALAIFRNNIHIDRMLPDTTHIITEAAYMLLNEVTLFRHAGDSDFRELYNIRANTPIDCLTKIIRSPDPMLTIGDFYAHDYQHDELLCKNYIRNDYELASIIKYKKIQSEWTEFLNSAVTAALNTYAACIKPITSGYKNHLIQLKYTGIDTILIIGIDVRAAKYMEMINNEQ